MWLMIIKQSIIILTNKTKKRKFTISPFEKKGGKPAFASILIKIMAIEKSYGGKGDFKYFAYKRGFWGDGNKL